MVWLLSGLLHVLPIGLELSAGSQLSGYCILTPFMFQPRITETEKTGLACMHPPPSRYYRFSLKFMRWDVCQNPARALELGTLPKCPEQYFVLAHLMAWHYCNNASLECPTDFLVTAEELLPRISLCVPSAVKWRACGVMRSCDILKPLFKGWLLPWELCPVRCERAFYILYNHFFGRSILKETDLAACLFQMVLAAVFSFLPCQLPKN